MFSCVLDSGHVLVISVAHATLELVKLNGLDMAGKSCMFGRASLRLSRRVHFIFTGSQLAASQMQR